MYLFIIVIILIIIVFVLYKNNFCVENYVANNESIRTILNDLSIANFSENIIKCESIEGIDCIYCITVNGRKDYIQSTFVKYGLNEVNYIEACTPTSLSAYDYKKYSTTFEKNSEIFELVTKLPVHLSYLSCLYHAIKYKYKYVLIFEDDVYFEEPFEKLKTTIEEFISQTKGDILYLGYCTLDCKTKVNLVSDLLAELPSDARILCKHGMVHNTKYVNDLIENHKKLNLKSDIYLNNFYRDNNLRRIVVRKPFVYQNRQILKSFNNNPSKLLYTCTF
jgi:hypothetical protein